MGRKWPFVLTKIFNLICISRSVIGGNEKLHPDTESLLLFHFESNMWKPFIKLLEYKYVNLNILIKYHC